MLSLYKEDYLLFAHFCCVYHNKSVRVWKNKIVNVPLFDNCVICNTLGVVQSCSFNGCSQKAHVFCASINKLKNFKKKVRFSCK